MEYRVHRSEVLQDLYLVQTHLKLEGFKYYESLMEKAYADLLDNHDQIEKLTGRLKYLESSVV